MSDLRNNYYVFNGIKVNGYMLPEGNSFHDHLYSSLYSVWTPTQSSKNEWLPYCRYANYLLADQPENSRIGDQRGTLSLLCPIPDFVAMYTVRNTEHPG